jgi:transposase
MDLFFDQPSATRMVAMLKLPDYMDILALKKEGHSIRAIAQMCGHSRNTVRRVLRGGHTLKFKTPTKKSKLDAFKTYLTGRHQQYQLSAVRLLAEIKGMGYDGSLPTLRRFIRTLKVPGERAQRVTLRYETPPGQQAQADWAFCGTFPSPDGKPIHIYVFIIVLSCSRLMFIRFTTSMKLACLVECHQAAFEFFGGWPATILYDNMKQVRLSRSQWNEGFLDFCRHYGFAPKTHRPYRPRTKGKVERMVDYVKDNFLAGRTFDSLDDLNTQGRHWLEHTANARLHSTTERVPRELFTEKEQAALTAYATVPPYRVSQPVTRIVSWESLVHYQGSRYSVPPAHAGKTVQVITAAGMITIRCSDLIIAEHPQALKAGQCLVQREHLDELWKLAVVRTPLPADQPRWQFTGTLEVQQRPLQAYEEVTP